MNDAVGLVLFNAFSKFVVKDNGAGKVAIDLGEFVVGFLYDSVCSPILGLGLGILAAMVFKVVDMRETKLLELCLYVLIMYVPFLLAEMLDLSGIVTILFTGMAARAYVMPNVSEETAQNANTLFRLTAHLAETSIFLELGLSVFGMTGSCYAAFVLWSLVACLVGRALNVYPLVYVYNKYLRERGELESVATSSRHGGSHGTQSGGGELDHSNGSHHSIEMAAVGPSGSGSPKENDIVNRPSSPVTGPSDEHFAGMVRQDLKISSNTAHMLWFSGLRGAVAYACVRSFPDTFGHDDEFTVTTMVIVLVTVFGLGSTTEAALNLLRIEMNVDEDRYMQAWHQEQSQDGLILRVEEILQHYALRPETPIAVQTTCDDAHSIMALGEASIASDFRHHHSDHEDDDGVVVVAESQRPPHRVHHHHHALDDDDATTPQEQQQQQVRSRRKRESVFDYGNK